MPSMDTCIHNPGPYLERTPRLTKDRLLLENHLHPEDPAANNYGSELMSDCLSDTTEMGGIWPPPTSYPASLILNL